MVQRDLDVFIQVFDGRGGVGHAGRHHKGVEGASLLAALKVGAAGSEEEQQEVRKSSSSSDGDAAQAQIP